MQTSVLTVGRITPSRIVGWLMLMVLLAGGFVPSHPLEAAPIAQSSVQRIRFAPGATSGVVSGTLGSEQVARYVLSARAGQTMVVQPASYGAPVFVSVFDPSQVVMGSAVSGEQWTGRLPSTGDYYLSVYPSPYAVATGFQVRVEITNQAPPTSPTSAERIRFSPGAVSAQVTGFLPSGSSKSYVLAARGGQVMSIESWTNSGPFRFTVTTADGTPIGNGNQGDRWSGTLPRTEDYRIILQSPADAQAAHYGLVITIVNSTSAPTATPVPPTATPRPPTPTPGPTPVPTGNAERIRFARGTTSATVSGYVDPFSPARYVLGASGGQTMRLYLTALYWDNTAVNVVDANGNFLGTVARGESWARVLPSTGDYYIEVYTPRDSLGNHFSLWIDIR